MVFLRRLRVPTSSCGLGHRLLLRGACHDLLARSLDHVRSLVVLARRGSVLILTSCFVRGCRVGSRPRALTYRSRDRARWLGAQHGYSVAAGVLSRLMTASMML